MANISEDNPGGEIKESYWEVVKGEVIVTGLDHRPIGKRKIEHDEPLLTAKRILRGGISGASCRRPSEGLNDGKSSCATMAALEVADGLRPGHRR